MSELKIGDKVELKSGGPAMTVVHINDEGLVRCTWFSKDEQIDGKFPAEALEAWRPIDPEFHISR